MRRVIALLFALALLYLCPQIARIRGILAVFCGMILPFVILLHNTVKRRLRIT